MSDNPLYDWLLAANKLKEMKTYRLQVRITDKMQTRLEVLLATGLYGTSLGQVAERLIAKGLETYEQQRSETPRKDK